MADNTIQSIERALDVLEILGTEADGLSVATVSARAGLQKSTTHRILSTLKKRKYVVQDEFSRYRLSFRISRLSWELVSNFNIARVAVPILKRLSAEAREVVQLVMRDEESAVYLHREQYRGSSLRIVFNIGQHRPLHITGVGKSILAALDDDEIRAYWAVADKTRVTDNTICSLRRLMDEIGQSRQQGYALDLEESTYGIHCIAASFTSHTGKHDMAISIVGAKERMTPRHMRSLFPMLDAARHEIADILGNG